MKISLKIVNLLDDKISLGEPITENNTKQSVSKKGCVGIRITSKKIARQAENKLLQEHQLNENSESYVTNVLYLIDLPINIRVSTKQRNFLQMMDLNTMENQFISVKLIKNM